MKENKGSMIILTVIGIATLLIAVIGATFAYFTVSVDYVTPPTETVVQSTYMLIQFETLNELKYENAIPGRPSQSKDPAAKLVDNKLAFSLTSAQTMTASTAYEVYLVIDNMTYLTDNLVYMMNETREVTNEANANNTAGSQGIEIREKSTTDTIIENNVSTLREVGVISKDLKAGDKIKIATGNLGSHASKDIWEFEVWIKETGENQNIDQGKILEAHIEVEPLEQPIVSFEPDKISTTTQATP